MVWAELMKMETQKSFGYETKRKVSKRKAEITVVTAG